MSVNGLVILCFPFLDYYNLAGNFNLYSLNYHLPRTFITLV
jgi:hypothetical protein